RGGASSNRPRRRRPRRAAGARRRPNRHRTRRRTPRPRRPTTTRDAMAVELLVSRDQAIAHLRLVADAVTQPADLADLGSKILASQIAILGNLAEAADPAWTADTVPEDVRLSIELYLGSAYENRGDGETEPGPSTPAETWDTIKNLLMRRRMPGVAGLAACGVGALLSSRR